MDGQTAGPIVPKLGMSIGEHLRGKVGYVRVMSRNTFFLIYILFNKSFVFKGTLLLILINPYIAIALLALRPLPYDNSRVEVHGCPSNGPLIRGSEVRFFDFITLKRFFFH